MRLWRRAYFPVLCLLTTPLYSQASRVLTLDQSIDIALGRSFDSARLEQSLINSQMSLQAAQAGLKSNSQLNFTSFPDFQDQEVPTNTATGTVVFPRQKVLTFQADWAVNQPIKLTDGLFTVAASMQRFQQFESTIIEGGQTITIDERINYSPQLFLQFRQPVLTLNRLKTDFRKAELNLEKTRQSYTQNQLDIVHNVTIGFYQLFQAQRTYEIDTTLVRQSENAYRLARLKQQAGLLAELDVLRLEVDLANAQNRAAASLANLQQVEDGFKVQIGIPVDERIRVTTELTYEPTVVTLEKALGEALARRTELRTDEIDIELSTIGVKETDSIREIKGELNLIFGIFQRAETFSDAFSSFNDQRQLTFSLTVPLWDWSKNHYEVQAAEASLESNRLIQRNRIETIKQEVRTAVRNFHSAEQRVDITGRSEELAQKSYDISLLKFENGDLSTQDLALEQNRLTDARVNSLGALIDYRQALSDLRRKTLWDFEQETAVDVEVPEY